MKEAKGGSSFMQPNFIQNSESGRPSLRSSCLVKLLLCLPPRCSDNLLNTEGACVNEARGGVVDILKLIEIALREEKNTLLIQTKWTSRGQLLN